MINVQGRILPVLNSRQLFQLPAKQLEPDDIFIIIKSSDFNLILIADEIYRILENPTEPILPVNHSATKNTLWNGMLHLDEKIVLIQDIEYLVSFMKEEGIYGV